MRESRYIVPILSFSSEPPSSFKRRASRRASRRALGVAGVGPRRTGSGKRRAASPATAALVAARQPSLSRPNGQVVPQQHQVLSRLSSQVDDPEKALAPVPEEDVHRTLLERILEGNGVVLC